MALNIVQCDSCSKRFKIPEAMYERYVQGRIASARCKYCKAPLTIDGRNPPKPTVAKERLKPPVKPLPPVRATLDSLPCAAPPESESGYWVVSLADSDAEMTFPDLRTAIEQRHIPLDTLLWRPGMKEWQRADCIQALRLLSPGV